MCKKEAEEIINQIFLKFVLVADPGEGIHGARTPLHTHTHKKNYQDLDTLIEQSVKYTIEQSSYNTIEIHL